MDAALSVPAPALAAPSLLVDDDEFVRRVLDRQLRTLGVSGVLVASDGHEARRLLREGGPFRLIVIDLKMPGCDGVELLRDIAVYQAQAALVLVSSANEKVLRTVRQLALARQLRVVGAFHKPVRLEDLRAVVDALEPGPPREPPSPLVHALAGAEPPLSVDALHAALRERAIDIHVQPEIDLASGTVHGVEVLARWTRPGHGPVRPDQFVPLAESNGLIGALTERVLQRALDAGRQWHDCGLTPYIAVNLSPSCLDELNLPERIMALAAERAFEPSRLQLEITESGLAGDSTRSLDVLTRLRLHGMELSLDDFGTGYSSLQQLQRIPFSQLKVDRSFVMRAADEADARHIVEANIRLAHGMGLRVVAEGVETAAQLALLRALDCDLVQGYLLARPMPVAQFADWVRGFRMV